MSFAFHHYINTNFVSENRSKKKSVFCIYSHDDSSSCNIYILFNDMGKQLFLSVGLSIISTLFQYIVLDIYVKLTNPSYVKIFFENNFGIRYGFATSQSSRIFVINSILFIIATLMYMRIKKDLKNKLYWLLAFIPIFYFSYVAMFCVAQTSIHKIENMVLILIPVGYFIAFYYNYRMINKEKEKK